MEYSETEKQMLREILPGIATQLRGSLANIHAALGRLAPEQAPAPTPTAVPPFCARAITASCGW